MEIKIIEIINNCSITDLMLYGDDALSEFFRAGRFHAELINVNEYGAKSLAATCVVSGDPIELLRMIREACSNDFGYALYPIE